jgi:hypothetical protein
MKRGNNNKWNNKGNGNRWSSSDNKNPQPRPAPKPVEMNAPTPPQSLSERLPTLSDTELTSLLGNAKRVSEETANKKMATAAELIPLIEAEQARRVVAKAEAGVVRKKGMAVQRATVKARRIATAAAENAGKLDATDEDGEEE